MPAWLLTLMFAGGKKPTVNATEMGGGPELELPPQAARRNRAEDAVARASI
jgi:hypothetical protein